MNPKSTTTSIEAVLKANRQHVPNYNPARILKRPRLRLAVVTCMDTRLSYRTMGLRPGDAHLETLERLKTNYEERAYLQLKALVNPARP